MLTLKIHSMVDVITNSSTTIYVYQNSTKQAKELVAEILKLSGEKDLTPDDVFWYGEFCDDDVYFEIEPLPTGFPEWNRSNISYSGYSDIRKNWFDNLKKYVLIGQIEKPEWMVSAEKRGDEFSPSKYLVLLPKNEKYATLAKKISELLGSVGADGGYDG